MVPTDWRSLLRCADQHRFELRFNRGCCHGFQPCLYSHRKFGAAQSWSCGLWRLLLARPQIPERYLERDPPLPNLRPESMESFAYSWRYRESLANWLRYNKRRNI